MAKIMSFDKTLLDALKAAGIATDLTTRVVIDIQAGHPVVIHTQQMGDETVIDVVATLAGVQIDREPKPDGPPSLCGLRVGDGLRCDREQGHVGRCSNRAFG